ncbi:protein serine/threonine phosphatase [Segniliparus rotundus DSM 44985]|uniref:Serine/threonine protein phosphatase PstP n=1 Tax=Segniliparus rotundus (strain ATCC BAA-972 / CDC 1076 / CIP 108378 / DSM 44985 / JCM 13578) TaxID=640132 RepID=D6ZBA3_SEGRD|nr:PP2C family serine/threonine-protein phosphatase [Segniliparus rotundus]ADG96862.1 protein serine/threonine phosphatase [Segniliparus rotundus DSM 44985]
MSLVLRYAARSDRGLVRGNNEDAAYAGARLLALADGMGGHEAGEVASSLVINSLAPLDDEEPGGEILSKLENAVRAGNIAIAEHVAEHPERDGMGTTLSALLFTGTSIGLAHVGDSRAYLLRGGELTQITRDDTYVQSLIDDGRITAEEAHSHPQRSLILKALTGHEVQPTLNVREALAGDRYLLCSDGLSDVVSASTIETVLGEGDVDTAADKLVDLALRSGGPDNITVVVAEVADSGFAQTQPIIAGSALGEEQQHAPPPDSAAGRAAALGQQQRTPVKVSAAEESADKPRRHWRLIAVLAVLLVALIAAAYGGRALLRSNYYTGSENGSVVIYRGVSGSLFGVRLQALDERVCFREPAVPGEKAKAEFLRAGESRPGCAPLRLTDLEVATRSSVPNLPSGGHDEVQGQVRLLLEHLLPNCADHARAPLSAPAAPAPMPSIALPAPPPPSGEPAPSSQSPFPSIEPSIELPAPPSEVLRAWKPGIDCRERLG